MAEASELTGKLGQAIVIDHKVGEGGFLEWTGKWGGQASTAEKLVFVCFCLVVSNLLRQVLSCHGNHAIAYPKNNNVPIYVL